MHEKKIKIIDGRHANIGCSFEAYVNDSIEQLAMNIANTEIRVQVVAPDYCVIYYIHDTARDPDVPP
ncbi:MAG: hypothetical protein IJ309_02410 [Clostridia bacterium]|nr:hypothetical protein [Clostridia bacterium]